MERIGYLRMRKRTYKARHEKLFRDELPADGQKIAFRGYAQKTYFTGVWNAATRRVVTKNQGDICLDDPVRSLLIFGWYPVNY